MSGPKSSPGSSPKPDLPTQTASNDASATKMPDTQDVQSQGSPSDEKPAKPGDRPEDSSTEYPSGVKLVSVMVSIFLVMFCFSLDRTIIGVAIPQITSEFHSLDDIGWYTSILLLMMCCFMLIFGKLYSMYSIKWTYLTMVVLFELGSVVCGAAPNSGALIAGRALTGLGSAGMMNGAMVIMTYTVPLHQRPMYQGLFGAVFGIASVIGPILGGAFTDHVTWRWSFYINLPIGGITIVALIFLLHLPAPKKRPANLRELIKQLDPLGNAAFMPGVICLVLALNWGGDTYAWASGRIIALLVLGSVLLLVFAGIEIWEGEAATVPPRLCRQRSVIAAFLAQFFSGSSMLVLVNYLPIWFQAVQGVSAVSSGLRVLPLLLALMVGSFAGGASTRLCGYYTPSLLVSSVFQSVGAGLITTWTVDAAAGKWIGYQVIYGLGLGLGLQQPNLAIQTVLPKHDVGVGASLLFFFQSVGASIFLAVAKTIFSNSLGDHLASNGARIDGDTAMHLGATNIRSKVPPQDLAPVLHAYNDGIMDMMYLPVALSVMSMTGSLLMEWRKIEKKPKKKDASQEKPDEKV